VIGFSNAGNTEEARALVAGTHELRGGTGNVAPVCHTGPHHPLVEQGKRAPRPRPLYAMPTPPLGRNMQLLGIVFHPFRHKFEHQVVAQLRHVPRHWP